MARSIYVPLESDERDLLRAMAARDKRSIHDQAAWLISQALDRWRAEQALEGSLNRDQLEEVA